MKYEVKNKREQGLFFRDLSPGDLFLLSGENPLEKGVLLKTYSPSKDAMNAIVIRSGLLYFVFEKDFVKKLSYDKITFYVEE